MIANPHAFGKGAALRCHCSTANCRTAELPNCRTADKPFFRRQFGRIASGVWPCPKADLHFALKRQSTENNPRKIDGLQYVIENHWDSVTIREDRAPRRCVLNCRRFQVLAAVRQFGSSRLRGAIWHCRDRSDAAGASISRIEHLFKHQMVLNGKEIGDLDGQRLVVLDRVDGGVVGLQEVAAISNRSHDAIISSQIVIIIIVIRILLPTSTRSSLGRSMGIFLNML